MNVYITRINGACSGDTAQLVQNLTAEIAYQIGCREMGIYHYKMDSDPMEQLHIRTDGIIAGIQAGDIVICQFPTWNGLKFERILLEHIRVYRAHVVIFVHDFEPLMLEAWRHKFQETIDLYNQAEVLIVASYALRDYMLENGIRKDMKFVIQEIWDYPTDICFMDKPILKKEIHFAGHAEKFTFINGWNYEVPLTAYSSASCSGENMRNRGWMNPSTLLLELSKGGFGLVWSENETVYQYIKFCNSTKTSLYLAAGIPVIVPRGISNQYLIEENHLGIAVDSLEEAVEKVRGMTEEEYAGYVAHVGKFAPLLRQGYFAKKLITEAVHLVFREDG